MTLAVFTGGPQHPSDRLHRHWRHVRHHHRDECVGGALSQTHGGGLPHATYWLSPGLHYVLPLQTKRTVSALNYGNAHEGASDKWPTLD